VIFFSSVGWSLFCGKNRYVFLSMRHAPSAIAPSTGVKRTFLFVVLVVVVATNSGLFASDGGLEHDTRATSPTILPVLPSGQMSEVALWAFRVETFVEFKRTHRWCDQLVEAILHHVLVKKQKLE
jgi:hypothetical protein